MTRLLLFALLAFGFTSISASAQDWPQWRGLNRDGKVVDFKAPAEWPAELARKWSVEVGNGVATPALVGDRLFVFTRQGDEEVIRCLDAATGEVRWQNRYETPPVRGAASSFPGPRSSPAVSGGRVVTLGVHGDVSCLDADSGDLLWRKNELEGNEPRFQTSSSPIFHQGRCIVQLGGDQSGAIIAYDAQTGNVAWRWDGDGAAYSSPILATINGTDVILAVTARNMVVLGAADGKQHWMEGYNQGRYNAATPILVGDTVVYAGLGRGMTREKLIPKEGEKWGAEILWSNEDHSMIYNSPVLKDGLLYGLSDGDVWFCVHLESGKTLWSAEGPQRAGGQPPGGAGRPPGGFGRPPGGGGPPQGFGGQGRMQRGYGSIVDAGSVLFGLTPAGELLVFAPGDGEFQKIAGYKVAERNAFAHPVIAGNRVFIKDTDHVTLWTVE